MPNISLAIAEPPARRDFLLREKLHTFPALHMEIAEERFVPAIKREPRHGGGHADVDADHAGLGAVLELAGRLAVARED